MADSNKQFRERDKSVEAKHSVKRRHVLKSTALFAGTAGLSGCANLSGEEDENITFGIPVPTSGPPAVYGDGTVEGAELAIEEEFGGDVEGQSVNVVVRDTGGDPGTAVPVAEELISEENADILLGGFTSASCLAIMEVVQREEVPYIPMATSVAISGAECNRYTFHHSPNSRQNAASVLAAHEEGVFDTLHIHHADFGGEIDMADATELTLEDTDAEVVDRTDFPPDAEDFSAGISAARNSGADAIFVITHPGGVIAFLTQAIQAGLKDEMTFIFPMLSGDVGAAVDPEALENTYGSNSFYWRQDGAEDFSESFLEEYEYRPSWWHAGSYEGTTEFLSAIERANGSTDPDDIIDQLRGHEFNHLGNPAQWRECDHLTLKDMLLLRGNGPDKREEDADYFSVVTTRDAEVSTFPCEEKECEM